jgi:beta-galactosidase/beta-glucuronidase
MAEVWINGKNAGSRLWRPFSYDISGLLKEGENNIRIRVGNLVHNEMSLINDVEESIHFWGKTGIPLHNDLDAGLFGPVKITLRK